MAENYDNEDPRNRAATIRRVRARRSCTMSLGLIVGAVWIGLWLDPVARPLLAWVLVALGVSLLILLAAMTLGGLGLVGMNAFDRALAHVRRAGQWPEE